MKFLTSLTAIVAAASAVQVYPNTPAGNYASPSVYQSQVEYQQHALYSGQPQPFVADATYHGRPSAEKTARILSYVFDKDGHSYQYSYETENGIKAQEAGVDQGKGVASHGTYSYKGDDGQEYSVSYTADELGFRPQGAHLPTPPPVPEAIIKALEQNAKDEAAGVYDDGHYEEPKYASTSYEHGGHHEQAIAQSSGTYHKRSS